MSPRPILDAGPALTFFATNSERLLLSTLGPISIPETVASEIISKSASDTRLAAAAAVWKKLEPTRFVDVLSDDSTPELSAAVERIGKLPIAERLLQPKDLGEIMVVSHAATQAEVGAHVIVLIDDGAGARLAQAEAARLHRIRKDNSEIGSIQLVNTHTVLVRAAGTDFLKNRGQMRNLYERMRGCDDGLVDIRQTNLLSNDVWANESANSDP